VQALFRTTDLTWSFLRTIVLWSVIVAAAVAVGSCVLVCDPRFTVTFLVAAAFDVGTLAVVMRDARTYMEHGAPRTGQRMAAILGIRLALKALLLGVAAFLPAVFSFLGMVLGVLLVDTTILIIGSAVVIWRMPRQHAHGSSRGE